MLFRVPRTNGFYNNFPILADHSRRITNHIPAATTRQLQEQFAGCIFHNEDKRASSLRIFCPCQYFQCIEKTFLDSAIFARPPENPGDCLHITMQHLKNQFAKDYPWAMGKGNSLPAGYNMAQSDLSLAFSPPHSNQCWALWPNFFFSWFLVLVPNILLMEMYINYLNFFVNMLLKRPTKIFAFTTKTSLDFSSALTPTDSSKAGICCYDSLNLLWVSMRMNSSPCPRSSRTILGTLLKAGLSGHWMSTDIYGLVTFLNWSLPPFRCRTFNWVRKSTHRYKDLRWALHFLQLYA